MANATVFLGDKRITTNVLKPDGTRAVGTLLTDPKIREAVLKNGKPYRGETTIIGKPFLAAYDPIRNAAGEVVGILYIGIPLTRFLAAVDEIVWQMASAAGAATLIVAGLLFWFTRRMLRPLRLLTNAVRDLRVAGLT